MEKVSSEYNATTKNSLIALVISILIIVSYEYYKTGYLLNTPGIDPESFDIKSLSYSRK
jgi:hypothetical protein